MDGISGPRTDEAVRGFQQALSLNVPSVAVDGMVGPVTWRPLDRHLTSTRTTRQEAEMMVEAE